jgi:HSP20 family protein
MTNKAIEVRRERKQGLAPWGFEYPLSSLQREMNRVFDNFFGGSMLWPFGPREIELESFYPEVDVVETENEIRVKADVPGMDEKDIHVSLAQNTLTIKGEKKEETEDKGKNYHQVERHWGSFYRSISLPSTIDATKADATFKKGVLTVTLPKTAEAKKEEKEIPIHA